MTKDAAAFVRRNTLPERPALVPEIALYLASEALPLWQASEDELERMGLPPPYWAFAWAGGQALARWILDHPEEVRGKRVFDFGSGSGLVAIAAAMAGASEVTACDIDPFALAAIRLNAELNGVQLALLDRDPLDEAGDWEIVLAGDICYEQPLAEQAFRWLQSLAARGAAVYLGDPQRTYTPRSGLARVAHYAVPTTKAIEDSDLRNATVWRVEPA
ncbi:class I SAM-dependent methyltransferase [Aquibaculum sediminis]|uniref:class I SAM-dependent methyltransferase n=1 Tax=Aquibaculum sediminis TaxID=3231907 RepID=UPI00345272FC